MEDFAMHLLGQLFVEQTTPSEVVLFLFSATVLCLLVASCLYVLGMSLIWLIRLRWKGVEFHQVFFPSKRILFDNLVEYLLATGTAVVLSVAMVQRHTVVEAVRNQPLSNVGAVSLLRGVLPLQVIPDTLTKAATGMTLGSFLKPVLDTGRPPATRTAVEAVMAAKNVTGPSTAWLLVWIGLLVLGQLAYLGWHRYSKLVASPDGAGSPGYLGVGKKLLVLAVSVALLLVGYRQYADAENLADSVTAAVKAYQTNPSNEIQRAVEVQRRDLAVLEGSYDPTHPDQTLVGILSDQVARLRRNQDRLSRRLDSALTTLHNESDSLQRQLTGVGASAADASDLARTLRADINNTVQALQDEDGRQNSALQGLSDSLRLLTSSLRREVGALRALHSNEGEVMVVGMGSAEVRSANMQQVLTRGRLPLSRRLPPGRYRLLVPRIPVIGAASGTAPSRDSLNQSLAIRGAVTARAVRAVQVPRTDTLDFFVRADRITTITIR
jgi:hypothetical protein